MSSIQKRHILKIIFFVGLTWTFSASWAQLAPVNLGTAKRFAILVETGLTNLGGYPTISGDIGISPAGSSNIANFCLQSFVTYSTSTCFSAGKIYAADYSPPTPAMLSAAIGDMTNAYADAATRLGGIDKSSNSVINGMSLPPGIYKWNTNLLITGDTLTLSGDQNGVWILQINGNLDIAPSIPINMNGGLPKNVFWQVSGTVTLNPYSHLEGNVLSQGAITLGNGASVNGRLLSKTSVSLYNNTVTMPSLVPGSVSGLTVTPLPSGTEMVLNWTKPGDSDLLGTIIVRKRDTNPSSWNDGTIVSNVSPSITSFHDTGLATGTNYFYTLVTYNADATNMTYAMGYATTTTNPAPGPIMGLYYQFPNPNQFAVNWDSTINATGYEVLTYSNNDKANAVSVFKGSSTIVQFVSPIPNHTYYLLVIATNLNGKSTNSTTFSVTTFAVQPDIVCDRIPGTSYSNGIFTFTNKVTPIGTGGVEQYRYMWDNFPGTPVAFDSLQWIPQYPLFPSTGLDGSYWLHIASINSFGTLTLPQKDYGPFIYSQPKPGSFSLTVDKPRIDTDGVSSALVQNRDPILTQYGTLIADGSIFIIQVQDGKCILDGVGDGTTIGMPSGFSYLYSTNGNIHFSVRGVNVVNYAKIYVFPAYNNVDYLKAGAEIGLLISPPMDIKDDNDAIVFDTVVNPNGGTARFFVNSKKTEKVHVQIFNMKSKMVKEWDVTGSNLQYLEWDLHDQKGLSVPGGLYGVSIKGDGWSKQLKVYLKGW